MRVMVCIDDTDSLDSIGTGDLTLALAKAISDFGWGHCTPVVRHQLFIHADIPYTSHNSSMSFMADITEEHVQPLIDYASAYLKAESAPGSDPGLCVACIDSLAQPGLLTEFGYRAKREVIKKHEAYELARLVGVHLSEHGGTGLGIVGALAGAGLRMAGNDGRVMGKLKIKCTDHLATVSEILRQTKVDLVRALDGMVLEPEETIHIDEKWFKAILQDSMVVVPVTLDQELGEKPFWRTCNKRELKSY